jgi:hypothetical protein
MENCCSVESAIDRCEVHFCVSLCPGSFARTTHGDPVLRFEPGPACNKPVHYPDTKKLLCENFLTRGSDIIFCYYCTREDFPYSGSESIP